MLVCSLYFCISAAYAVMWCLSVCVCLSVRLSRFWILSKQVIVSSIFFTVFPHKTSRQYSDGNLPSNGCVECRWGMAEIAILSQYLAPSHAVNRSSGKCNTLSYNGPWRVDDTSRW